MCVENIRSSVKSLSKMYQAMGRIPSSENAQGYGYIMVKRVQGADPQALIKI